VPVTKIVSFFPSLISRSSPFLIDNNNHHHYQNHHFWPALASGSFFAA
jgi:hypothetical protein